ncbi:MAG: biopolymer transporter ExbD [Verrucomicrobia bacterium]|nr:biopolymer transporter ExbD [Verrucomicrobiota bacterium]
MARKKPLSTLREISEINMTPLMDLTFILLITFIITFPLIEQGIPVSLPKGEAEELDPEETRTITMDVQGRLYLDDVPISKEELNLEMKTLSVAVPDITIFVRADEKLQYGGVVEIMRILHDAQITRMALVTESEKQ